MKLLTTNFLTCAVKACKSSPASFPLHFRDAVLERTEIAYNPLFMANILPRLNWDALRTTATELGLGDALPRRNPSDGSDRAPPRGPQAQAQEKEKKTGPEADKDDGMDVDDDGEKAVASDGDGDGGPGGGGPSVGGEAEAEEKEEEKEEVLKKLHGLLLETSVAEGKLVCGNCGFEYPIKDGVGNFLLPAHLV